MQVIVHWFLCIRAHSATLLFPRVSPEAFPDANLPLIQVWNQHCEHTDAGFVSTVTNEGPIEC